MAGEDHLAYGEFAQSGEDEPKRGILSDFQRNFHGNRPGGLFSNLLDHASRTAQELGSKVVDKIREIEVHSHTHLCAHCSDGYHSSLHRYTSFARQRNGNLAKWFVDGCGYMWAVSVALEQATESIWILDCEHRLPSN